MKIQTTRALKFWAICDLLYGLILGALIWFFLPWKSPAANVLLLGYAMLHPVAGHGMWRRYVWGWRVSVVAAWLGLAAGLLLSGALLASGIFLWGTFGDFGYGAAIGAFLFSSVALQAFMLYPGLKLRTLMSVSVREDLGLAKKWTRATLGLLCIPLLCGATSFSVSGIQTKEPVSKETMQRITQHIRASLDGKVGPGLDILDQYEGEEELYLTLWRRGAIAARVSGDGSDMRAALDRAVDGFKSHPAVFGQTGHGGQIKVDRIVGESKIPFPTYLLAMGVNPGLDGLRHRRAGSTRTLLPEDLVRQQKFGAAPLVPGIRELRLGLDARSVLKKLAPKGLGELWRFRTQSWIETEGGVLPVYRGNTPVPEQTREAWDRAAVAGGDFVLRQIQDDGRFHYQYFPLKHRHPSSKKSGYSIPRHAGTVYSLALLFRYTGKARFRKGAEKAIAWLSKRLHKGCGLPAAACIKRRGRADLGSAALTAVGLLEYQRSTGDQRYAQDAHRLLAFIGFLQKENGDFHHLYELKTRKVKPQYRSMFYSEEAALALVMGHKILGDQIYLDAAKRALDYLTGPKYDFFLGRFIYGADHWTCIAAEEAWPALKEMGYLDFCEGYAAFISRMQYEPGLWDNVDFVGHYGFSGLTVPQAPAAAGFTEAVVSTLRLAHRHGRELARLETQMGSGLDALLSDQIRKGNSWMFPNPNAAHGGFRRSLVEQEVRIDFTQHALSALMRGAHWADDLNGR